MNKESSTILIVDDELPNRELLEHMLQPEGYITVSVASGKQALAAVADWTPDLILLDISMPGMDGFEVASVLKANPATATIPIIVVTAHAGREWRVISLESGAEDLLTKPVDPTELLLKVRNLLRLKSSSEHAQRR